MSTTSSETGAGSKSPSQILKEALLRTQYKERPVVPIQFADTDPIKMILPHGMDPKPDNNNLHLKFKNDEDRKEFLARFELEDAAKVDGNTVILNKVQAQKVFIYLGEAGLGRATWDALAKDPETSPTPPRKLAVAPDTTVDLKERARIKVEEIPAEPEPDADKPDGGKPDALELATATKIQPGGPDAVEDEPPPPPPPGAPSITVPLGAKKDESAAITASVTPGAGEPEPGVPPALKGEGEEEEEEEEEKEEKEEPGKELGTEKPPEKQKIEAPGEHWSDWFFKLAGTVAGGVIVVAVAVVKTAAMAAGKAVVAVAVVAASATGAAVGLAAGIVYGAYYKGTGQGGYFEGVGVAIVKSATTASTAVQRSANAVSAGISWDAKGRRFAAAGDAFTNGKIDPGLTGIVKCAARNVLGAAANAVEVARLPLGLVSKYGPKEAVKRSEARQSGFDKRFDAGVDRAVERVKGVRGKKKGKASAEGDQDQTQDDDKAAADKKEQKEAKEIEMDADKSADKDKDKDAAQKDAGVTGAPPTPPPLDAGAAPPAPPPPPPPAPAAVAPAAVAPVDDSFTPVTFAYNGFRNGDAIRMASRQYDVVAVAKPGELSIDGFKPGDSIKKLQSLAEKNGWPTVPSPAGFGNMSGNIHIAVGGDGTQKPPTPPTHFFVVGRDGSVSIRGPEPIPNEVYKEFADVLKEIHGDDHVFAIHHKGGEADLDKMKSGMKDVIKSDKIDAYKDKAEFDKKEKEAAKAAAAEPAPGAPAEDEEARRGRGRTGSR